MLFLSSSCRPLRAFHAAANLTFVMAPSVVGADNFSIHGFIGGCGVRSSATLQAAASCKETVSYRPLHPSIAWRMRLNG